MDFTTTSHNLAANKVGLRNLGNTCYMNSAIQALYSCDSFRDTLLTSDPDEEEKVTNELRQLFALLQESKKSSIAPTRFLETAIPSYFSPGKQQDSSEFMRHLLDTIHEEELSSVRKKYKSKPGSTSSRNSAETTLVQELFQIELQNTYTCCVCKYCYSKTENRLDLILPFPEDNCENNSTDDVHIKRKYRESKHLNNNEWESTADAMGYKQHKDYKPQKYEHKEVSLEDILKHIEKKEEFESFCEKCRRETKLARRTKVTHYPPYLILILGRFKVSKYAKVLSKIMDPVDYPRDLCLPISRRNHESERYIINALVAHIGTTLYVGHYTCYSEHSDRSWYCFDDSYVTLEQFPPLDETTSGITTSFMFIYRTKSGLSKKKLPVSLPPALKQYVKQHDATYNSQEFVSWTRSFKYGVSDLDFQNIAADISSEWKTLAKELGIKVSTVKNFEETYRDSTEACYKILCYWLSKNKDTLTLSRQEEKLNQAVKQVKGETNEEDMEVTPYSEGALTEDGHAEFDDGELAAIHGVQYMELLNLAANVGKEWKILARYLHMTKEQIETFERRFPKDNKAGFEMLYEWKFSSPIKLDQDLTNELNEAIRKMRKHTSVSNKEPRKKKQSSQSDAARGVSHSDLKHVATAVGSRWVELAEHLGVSKAKINSLNDAKTDDTNTCYEMLCQWQMFSPNSEETQIEHLNDALAKLKSENKLNNNTRSEVTMEAEASVVVKTKYYGVTDNDFQNIAADLSENWKMLANILKLKDYKIKSIEGSCKDNIKACYEVLKEWKYLDVTKSTFDKIDELNEAVTLAVKMVNPQNQLKKAEEHIDVKNEADKPWSASSRDMLDDLVDEEQQLKDAMHVVKNYGNDGDVDFLIRMAELYKVSDHEIVIQKINELLNKQSMTESIRGRTGLDTTTYRRRINNLDF